MDLIQSEDLIKLRKNCHHLKPFGLVDLLNLIRYETFARADYGCMSHALHLPERRDLTIGKLDNRSI